MLINAGQRKNYDGNSSFFFFFFFRQNDGNSSSKINGNVLEETRVYSLKLLRISRPF